MDTKTKEPSRAIGLLAKAISQTGVSVIALLALLVAAILNADLWIQFGVAVAFVALNLLIASRINRFITEPFGSPEEQELVTLATQEISDKERKASALAKYGPAATLVIGIISVVLSAGEQFNLVSALTVFAACLLLTNSKVLSLVIPFGFSRTMRLAFTSGVVIRNRAAFEKLAKVNLLLFTKGGVLTELPKGVNSVRLSTKTSFKDESKLLALAASVESLSEHAFAKAITRSAENSNLRIAKPKTFREFPGFGVEGLVSGKRVLVGSTALLLQRNIRMEVQEIIYADESTKSGYSIVCVVVDGVLEGILRFTDVVKESSVDAVYLVARERIRVGIITGDSAGTAQQKAEQLNISEVYGELSPELKAMFVTSQQAKGALVGVIANPDTDSALLDQADVSIALGEHGSDTADVSISGDDPETAALAVALSARLRKKSSQSIAIGLGYSLVSLGAFVAIVSPLQVVTAPVITAMLGSLSLIVVTMNTYSLRKLK
jgi:Cu2+-exporting ATPase